MNNMKLIVIDGLDGVGKDTQAELIKKRYLKKDKKVLIRSHPTSDNYFGKKAKNALLGHSKLDKIRAGIFYMLDVLRSVKKYYKKDDIDVLIMVRYLVGTAYLPKRLAKISYKFFLGFVPLSKYMFFLDASPKDLMNRLISRSELEIFETPESLKKVRNKALLLVKNWYVIDASGSIQDTYSRLDKILDFLDETG